MVHLQHRGGGRGVRVRRAQASRLFFRPAPEHQGGRGVLQYRGGGLVLQRRGGGGVLLCRGGGGGVRLRRDQAAAARMPRPSTFFKASRLKISLL